MSGKWEAQLEDVLSRDPAAILARKRAAYEAISGRPGRDLILCGSGYLGKSVLCSLRKTGREPLAFCDNNPRLWDQQVNGLPVLSPEAAVARFGSKALFVITVYTSGPLLRQIRDMGVTVISFPEFAWANPESLLPHAALDLPNIIFEMAKDVREGLGVWQEEASLAEYVGQLRWRVSLDPSGLPPSLPPDQIYFPDNLLAHKTDEVFVDCGAYDGDSIRAFIERRETSFQEAIGIEADPGNYARLESSFASMPDEIRQKLKALNLAVGSDSSMIRFNATGTAGSSVGKGEVEIRCVPLDEVLEGRVPTYIKMDIEGAEREALLGARQTIEKYAPILAICLYHRPEDLWRIPLLIQSIQPSYRMFLRRYSADCWEQVCYAIPEDRLR